MLLDLRIALPAQEKFNILNNSLGVHGLGANETINNPFNGLGIPCANLSGVHEGSILVLDLQEQTDLLAKHISESMPSVLLLHSLACLIGSFLDNELTNGISELYIVAPVYSEEIRQGLIDRYSSETDISPNNDFYITPEFIQDLTRISCVDRINKLIERFKGNIHIILPINDYEKCGHKELIDFVNNLKRSNITIHQIDDRHNCASQSFKDIFIQK